MNRTCVLLVFTLSLLSSMVMGQITLQGKWRPTGKRSSLPQVPDEGSSPSGGTSALFLLQVPANDLDSVSGLSLRPQIGDGDLDQLEQQQQQRSRMIWQRLVPPGMKQKREKVPQLMK